MVQRRASQIEHTGSALSQSAAEQGAMASRRVSDILRRAADDISGVGTAAYPEKIKEHVEMARERVDEGAEMVKTNIREHPLTSVAMAVGVGFMAGAAISLLGSQMYRETRP